MDAGDPDLRHWLRLTSIPGVGGEARRRLLGTFGLPQSIFSSPLSSLAATVDLALAERLIGHDADKEIDAGLSWAAEAGNHIVALADAEYPQALLDQEDPPLLLYAKGRLDLLNLPAIAVVGSRNATRQGEANAEAFAESLSQAGMTVVSGLALGVDAAAHRGALKGSASTIAVIGTGPDRIYPARNQDLARNIAEQGLIVSEFPVGMPPLAANFPRRNRVIAGLGHGCLVVEAAERSGSLITARLAAEVGREVFAIPGSIHSPLSRGCHALIRQGAKLVESAQDILEELNFSPRVAAHAVKQGKFASMEETPLLSALGHDPCGLDGLIERTGLTADRVLAMLMALELDGRVAQLPGGLYQRVN
jgi:DNA processing protein